MEPGTFPRKDELTMQPNSVLIIPLAGISLPLVLVPLILAFRHSAKKREFSHRERMKALETGRPVPGEGANPAVAVVCMAIGTGVPTVSFVFTWLASLTAPHLAAGIWVAPAVVSSIALLVAYRLASTLLCPVRASNEPLIGKPTFDPDAYDVVGSRG